MSRKLYTKIFQVLRLPSPLLLPSMDEELRVKYCQHLYRKRKLSLTHWRGEDNPADGLTKSLKPLSLWTNLVEAVGLVPGPNEKGQNWIRNFLQEIHAEETVKEIAQMNSESTNERKNEMDPTAGSKKGK